SSTRWSGSSQNLCVSVWNVFIGASSKELHLHALELREQELDAEHPKTAESLHNLAMLYGDQGRYKQAEKLYLRVLALEEPSKGPEQPDDAKTLNTLGLMYFYRKRYAEAETAYQRALMIYEFSTGPLAILLLRASGPEHSKVELVREKYASLLERL